MPQTKFLPRFPFVLLFVAAIIIGTAAPALAETMKVTTETKLRALPGEASKVLAKLKPDQKVEVLESQGRWLRVRAGKRVGWITRTTVAPLDAGPTDGSDAEWRKKNRKTRDAGAKAAAKRYVTAKSSGTVRREPNRAATKIYTLMSGDIASVEGQSEQGAWLLIENEHGQMGWIRASRVETVDDPEALLAARASATGEGSRNSRTVRKQRIIAPRVEAGLGYRGLGMDFQTNGGGVGLDEYRIEASSALTHIGAWVPLEVGGVVLEVGGRYAFSIARPGIRYQDQGDISFITHDAEAMANLGYRFMDDFLTVGASGGYHYSIFRTDQVDNAAYLPSERLTGITAGGFVELAPARGKYTLRSSVRLLLAGNRAQTPGLEDGTDSAANAWWADVDMNYALWQAFDLVAGYTFERASTVWGGPSMRRPGVTAAKRLEANHLLYLGVGRAF